VWALVKDYFEARVVDDGYAFLEKCTDPLRKISVQKGKGVTGDVERRVKQYVPRAVVPFVSHKEEKWSAELRRVTVLFVNLGLSETDLNAAKTSEEGLQIVQRVLTAVQRCVYKYEGSLNKFLMDDKGSTLVAVFGLPPLAHDDDSVRGLRASAALVRALRMLGTRPSVGVTTGQVGAITLAAV
jgi:adenylate cyclase 10